MGVLAKFGSWLIGGNPGNGMEVVKGVGNWIDEQQWTEQEKAEWLAKRADLYAKFMKQTIQENSERSRTRRSLSLMALRWWFLALTFSGLLYPLDQPWSEYWWKLATNEWVAYLILGIGAYFWGSHLVRDTKLAKD